MRRFFLAIFVLTAVLSAAPAVAAVTYSASGSYHSLPTNTTPNNWGSGTTAFLGYGGTNGYVQIDQTGTAGGTLTCGTEWIGDYATNGGNGAVTVIGGAATAKYTFGSTTGPSGGIYLGYDGPGTGTVSVENGGYVYCATNVIGGAVGGNGTMTVDGVYNSTPSTWYEPYGNLTIGNGGTGAMNITNGGMVTTKSVLMSGQSSSTRGTGTAIVDGMNGTTRSTWTIPGGTPNNIPVLYVGNYGSGSLQISNGGLVTPNNSVYIGSNAGSAGTVIVEGINAGTPSQLNANGTLIVGESGAATLTIANGGQVSNQAGYIGDQSGSTSNVVTVSGSSGGSPSEWINSGSLYVGNSGSGTLNICGGGAVYATAASVNATSVLSIDVGPGSSLWVGGGSGTLTNNGTVRVVAGAGASTSGNPYSPISAAWAGSGSVQPVGGTWNSGANQFTVSTALTGTPGTPLAMDTSANQRATWTDAGGNTLGASFLAAAGTNPINPTVTALGGSMAPAGLAWNQFVLGDWGLSGVTASGTNPVYLSLSGNPIFNTSSLWCYNGSSWSQVTATSAPDLTFDGTYSNFTLTGSGGTGLGFDGYDYAVVGTPKLLGDANLDGRVDINDLTIVLANYNQTGMTWPQGDFTGDGKVDINDLTIVLANYNTSVGSSAGPGIGAVPEPGALALLAAGLAGLLACAWRKRK